MSDLMLDVGQANELKLALRRAGYDASQVKRLCEGDILAQFREVLLGNSYIVPVKTIPDNSSAQAKKDFSIDCDIEPYTPPGWKVVEHKRCGILGWDMEKFSDDKLLYWDTGKDWKNQLKRARDVRNAIANKLTMNANVLDFLISHPDQRPTAWQGMVFFWGTIYRSWWGCHYVRYLDCRNSRFDSGYFWLHYKWRSFFHSPLVRV